jgi:hypothetical protein
MAAGRAFAAAHPQTELITTKVVPSNVNAFSTSSGVFKEVNPAFSNSAAIGFVICSGYMLCYLNYL